MLKDEARTQTYRDAFKAHSADFQGKVVLDLGCGTGILAFFAVEAGAKLGRALLMISFFFSECIGNFCSLCC